MSPKTGHTTEQRTSESQPKPTPLATTSNGSTTSATAHVHFETSALSSPPQHIPPRARANSVLNRGVELAQNFTSPLAQIYQPLIVDDIAAIDDTFSTQQSSISSSPGRGPSPLISYGPASRRRLSSMQGLHRTTHNQGLQRSQSQRRPSPSHATGATQFPSVDEVADGNDKEGKVLSESPPPMTSPLPTVGQVLQEIDTEGTQTRLNKRLENIEQRQQRIESLLEKIAGQLTSGR